MARRSLAGGLIIKNSLETRREFSIMDNPQPGCMEFNVQPPKSKGSWSVTKALWSTPSCIVQGEGIHHRRNPRATSS